ncbi:hypothetical protein [Draconibacterium orientale]|uniref:hypothetical protein n=1 Tax=Draconibacterium orientale TaxID=1168034 RepID=UPI0029BFEDAD|nr:hypothetical protein [Draconibacterium orientale]
MADNTNLGLTVEAWADIVIERWEQKIERLNIGSSGQLIKSFYHTVQTQANGNPELIVFTFEYYGKFVDMGVGRGVTIEEVEFSNRRPKAWYSKVFFSQLEKLKELLAEKYARKAQLQILINVEKMDEDGKKIAAKNHSGSSKSSTIDSITGNRKITFKEFQKRREQNGW